MGRATDMASIQFRMLNRGKGPAVWAPRAQCDRALYRAAVRHLVESQRGITLVEGTVRRLLLAGGEARVAGVETMDGAQLVAALGRDHGRHLPARSHAHRHGHAPRAAAAPVKRATTHLAEQIAGLGIATARFKTGTPPRIEGNSVDRSVLERQDSEIGDFDYSWSAFWSGPCVRAVRAGALLDHVRRARPRRRSSRRTWRSRRCTAARSAHAGRAIARRSRTRSSDFRTPNATSCSSNPKDSTRPRCTSTACPRRFLPRCSSGCCDRFPGSNAWR